MRVGLFYFSPKRLKGPLGKAQQRIIVDGGTWGFVRVVVLNDSSLEEAVMCASPMPDESLMNAHLIDLKDWND